MAIRDVPKNTPCFGSLEEFLETPGVPPGLFSILINGYPADFEFDDRGHDTTVVLLHPALGSKVAKLPVFIGRSITQKISVNRLFVADPTLNLHEDLTLSWFAGSSKQPDLQDALGKIFRKVTEGHRAIYLGFSGGGFASLVYSGAHPGSLAIAVNPQSSIADYLPVKVRQWTNTAWGMKDQLDESTLSLPPVLTNVRTTYARPVKNHVVYVQNTGDTVHMDSQWVPFRDAVHPTNSLVSVLVYSGEGHVAPAAAYISEMVGMIAAYESWSALDLSGLKVSPLRRPTETGLPKAGKQGA